MILEIVPNAKYLHHKNVTKWSRVVCSKLKLLKIHEIGGNIERFLQLRNRWNA